LFRDIGRALSEIELFEQTSEARAVTEGEWAARSSMVGRPSSEVRSAALLGCLRRTLGEYPLPRLSPFQARARALGVAGAAVEAPEPTTANEARQALQALAHLVRGEDSALSNAEEGAAQDEVAAPAGRVDPTSHPDGPEAGCWLWWKNKRHDIPKGVVYRLVEYMWGRESASYDDLDGPVFEQSFQPGTLRGRCCEANKVLKKVGVPWRLCPDSEARQVTKQPRE
jgi:hypothetical protein